MAGDSRASYDPIVMRGLPRVTLVALTALGLGSWLGLGRPDEARLRELAFKARDAVNEATSPTATATASGEPVTDFAPSVTPETLDTTRPWPRLNPEASAKRAWLLAEGPYHPPGDGQRLVTLTFDDGPFPETTPSVLRLLAKYNIHATFFVLGRYLDGDDERSKATRDVLRQIVSAGHLVGNHTHDHHLLTQLGHGETLAQIEDGAASITKVIGKEPLVFRPPYGQVDMFTMQVLKEKQLELVLWNIEAEDMKNDDPVAMFQSIKGQLDYAGGGIVLLHDIRPSTVVMLGKLLEWMSLRKFDPAHKEKPGYQIVDLPAYIRATAESPQPFPDRIELERKRSAQHQAGNGRRPRR